jgi:hypothetical protein
MTARPDWFVPFWGLRTALIPVSGRHNTPVSGAEIARRVGVSRQVFHHRAVRYGFPRLPDGTYELEATIALWHDTTRGNGHGGARRNAGAKPRLVRRAASSARVHPEDVPIEALVDELMAEFHDAPWPGTFLDADAWRAVKTAGRRHTFTIAEAGAALAAMPLARAWLQFTWLMGGTWVPSDDDEMADDEGECRREMLRETLWWLTALYRGAG